MRRYLALLAFITSLAAYGQEKLEGHYLFTSLGFGFDQFNDAYISPNTYGGITASAGLGWHSYHGKWMNNLDVMGQGGTLSPLSYPEQSNEVVTFGGKAHYSLRYRFFEKSKHQLLAGLYSQNIFVLREHQEYRNSAQSFSGFFGYGPSIAYTYSYNLSILGRSWDLSWQSEWNIPLGTYMLRPNFIRQYSAGEIGDRGNHILNGTLQTDFRHSLIWHLSNGNQIRAMYAWEYFQTDRFNASYNGGHMFQIQLFLLL